MEKRCAVIGVDECAAVRAGEKEEEKDEEDGS